MISRSWLRALCLLPIVLLQFAATAPTAQAGTTPPSLHASVGRAAVPHAVAIRAGKTNSAGLTKEVFGFAQAGSLGDPTVGYTSWNFDLLSTVAFFSIGVNYNGILVADSNFTVWDSSTLTGLVATAHAHGVKVVMTLKPLANDAVDFCDMLYHASTTVVQTVNQINLKGVDGVNIDFEGPKAWCQPNPGSGFVAQSDQDLITSFAQQMRAGLDGDKPGLYLSIDTYSASAEGNDGLFNIAALNQYVDSFFVMTYDMDESGNATNPPLYCTSFCFNPVSPLQNYLYNDTKSMAEYSSLVGASKVILGQPYYGRAGCVSGPYAHATPISHFATATYLDSADAAASNDVKPGTYVIHRDAQDPNGLDRWDTWYDQSVPCWKEMYWSDATQLGTRYDLVNNDGLRGVGFWTLNYAGGASEVWDALQSHFLGCSSVTDTAAPVSPQPGSTPVTVTAVADCPDPNPLFEFWLLKPGATLYTLVRSYSTTPTYNWDTTGLSPGTYRFNVWVKDANFSGIFGNAYGRWDTYNALTTFTITSTPCQGVTEWAEPPIAKTGVSVTLNALASGPSCAHPQYEFWILSPGAALYTLGQAYSSSPTFTWSTGGNGAGNYRIDVWTRDASSWGSFGNAYGRWDAYNAGLIVPLTRGCPTVTESAPSSTATVGSTLTITASAPGCRNPLYQFWVLKPGASLDTSLGSYSATNTLTWDTTGLAKGTYRFNVWVHDSGDSGLYGNSYGRWDTYTATLTITLT